MNKIDRNTIWCRINIFMMENISLFTLNHPMCCTELIWPELRNQIRKTNFQLFRITNNRKSGTKKEVSYNSEKKVCYIIITKLCITQIIDSGKAGTYGVT